MGGWIKLHRRIVDSDIYVMPPLYLRVFERLVLEANHKDNEIPYREPGAKLVGKKLIKRGERLTSIRAICEWVAWYERNSLKVPNPKTIREILEWLVNNGMITIHGERGNRRETHYSIVNYEVYQQRDDAKVTAEKQPSNSQVTVTTHKQECLRMFKNEKNLTTTSKKIETLFAEGDIEYELALHLRKRILEVSSKTRVPKDTPAEMANWAKVFDYMLRLDKRDAGEIKRVIDWCQRDPFWQSNILSAGKLRQQYDKLVLRMGKRSGATKKGGQDIGDRQSFYDDISLYKLSKGEN